MSKFSVSLNTEMKICLVEAFPNVTQCGNLEYFMYIIQLTCSTWQKYSLLLQWQFIFLQECCLGEESQVCLQVEAEA